MPTTLEIRSDVKIDANSNIPARIEFQKESQSEAVTSNDENAQKKKSTQQVQQPAGSPRRKFMNRNNSNHQNGHRQNRNNSANGKRFTHDANNNTSSNKQPHFPKSSSTTLVKTLPNEYQQKQPNGHVEPIKKPQPKLRSITKSGQSGNYHYDNMNQKAAESSVASNSYNGCGDANSHIAPNGDDNTYRKYTKEFLQQVGYKIATNSSPSVAQNSPKSMKNLDDASVLALKLAFGDNSGNYTHFYSNAMYNNQLMIQQQYQYARYHQQHLQNLQRTQQRVYPRNQNDNYQQRMYHHALYHEQDVPVPLECHCAPSAGQQRQQQQMQMQRSFPPQTYSPSYQNRKHSDRRDFQGNMRKNRQGFGHQNGNFNKSNKDFHQNHRNGPPLAKSQSFSEDDSTARKNLNYSRTISEDNAFRSLSPTPPSSSKSSSPGAVEKEIVNNADDTESTRSASSTGTPISVSFVGDLKVSVSTPTLLEPDEPVRNVNVWIDSNFSAALHNGLSCSAENLSCRDPPITIIKRPPSVNGQMSRRSYHPLQRSPSYDPQNPFDYFLARAEESEMRIAPSNLRVGSKWDTLSSQMWEKFQDCQQKRETYYSKMVLWRDLYHEVRVRSLSFCIAELLVNFAFYRTSCCTNSGRFPNGACTSSDQRSRALEQTHRTSTCAWCRRAATRCRLISEWNRWLS